MSQLFVFARTLLGEKLNGKLEASKEEINNYLLNCTSDPAKEQELGINNRLIPHEPTVFQFDTSIPNWK